jgi:cell division protease FtsH
MGNVTKQAFFWVFMAFMIVAMWSLFSTRSKAPEEIWFGDFLEEVKQGRVENVDIEQKEQGFVGLGKYVEGYRENPSFKFVAIGELPQDWRENLRERGVEVTVKAYAPNWLVIGLANLLPLLLLIGVLYFFAYRQMQMGGNKALSFGKSKARLVTQDQKPVTFEDVAGVDEAKEELQEIIEFLTEPKKFTKLGGKIPKGVLLMGPPGSGKTLLARAVAGEAKVPFFSISGSDFVEMFVGVGASRVRDLFNQGQRHAPCIIFIDELDAVGRQRGAGLGGGHDEREQTLNQLLVEMDGFNANEGVILVAATNRPDVLDRALLRPGRFDRHIVVDNPDINGREGILRVHTKEIPLDDDVDLKILGRGTPGFSGADLANMVNEAALLAARRGEDQVNMKEFEDAKDRVLMGPERRSIFISEREKRMTAYHEAGHAVVAKLVPDADPVHKVTIIPRGPSLGQTQSLPTEDRHIKAKSYCLANIAVYLGGRAAEEIVFGETATGSAADIKMCTDEARRMVCEWGMSERIGPISFGENPEIFLGRDLLKERNFSEEVAAEIDREMRRIIDDCHETAKDLLTSHKEFLDAVAQALVDREVLEDEDLSEIMKSVGLEPVAADAKKQVEAAEPAEPVEVNPNPNPDS